MTSQKVASLTVGKEYRITYTVEVAGDGGSSSGLEQPLEPQNRERDLYPDLTCGEWLPVLYYGCGNGVLCRQRPHRRPMATAVTGRATSSLPRMRQPTSRSTGVCELRVLAVAGCDGDGK